MTSVTTPEPKPRFRAAWRALALGGLPHQEVGQAWKAMLTHLGEIPSWPQLPQRSPLENMYVQFSERFPGINLEGDRLSVDRRKDLGRGLDQLYLAYLQDDIEYGRMSGAHAASLEALRTGNVELMQPPLALKGQITGPLSWGLTVVDQNRRPILYDQILEDAVGKHLRLKAAWQERELQKKAAQTLIFVDEPYMASFGSSFISISRAQVMALLEEVFAGLSGLKGIHCCGNADWSIVLNTSVDIVSIDAYDYADGLRAYAEDLARFLERGGIIAWGIVPAGTAAMGETRENLVSRLERCLDRLVETGISREALMKASMVSPSCSLGALTVDLAEHILQLTASVSAEMRKRYIAVSSGQPKAN